jgi:CheY-like chemotaxis protein
MTSSAQIIAYDNEPLPAEAHAVDALRVMVVEDDEADAYLITEALKQDPRIYTIYHAMDGVEAIGQLDGGLPPPDAMIIDLRMPRMDGFKLLLELGCRPGPKPLLIVLTSSTAQLDLQRSKVRGADIVLSKPASLEELKGMLAKAMNHA